MVTAAVGADALGTGCGLRLSALVSLVGRLQGVRELGQRLVDPTVVLTVLLDNLGDGGRTLSLPTRLRLGSCGLDPLTDRALLGAVRVHGLARLGKYATI